MERIYQVKKLTMYAVKVEKRKVKIIFNKNELEFVKSFAQQ